MTIFGLTLTRDSFVWWLGMVTGLLVVGAAWSPETAAWFGVPAAWLPYIRLAALILSAFSGKMATSPLIGAKDAGGAGVGSINARVLPTVLLAAVLAGGTLTLPACAPKNQPALPPDVQAAYTADQIGRAISALRDAAIKAEAQGALPTDVTRVIVHFDRAAWTTLKATPAGWGQTVAAAWAAAKKEIPPKTLADPLLASLVSAVDVSLAAFLPTGGAS